MDKYSSDKGRKLVIESSKKTGMILNVRNLLTNWLKLYANGNNVLYKLHNLSIALSDGLKLHMKRGSLGGRLSTIRCSKVRPNRDRSNVA